MRRRLEGTLRASASCWSTVRMPWGFVHTFHIMSYQVCARARTHTHTHTPVCIHAGADVFGCDAPYSPLQARDRQPRGTTGESDERECVGTRRASKLAVRWGGNMALVQEGEGHGRGVKGHQSDLYRGADFGEGHLQEVRTADRCEYILCVYACIHASCVCMHAYVCVCMHTCMETDRSSLSLSPPPASL